MFPCMRAPLGSLPNLKTYQPNDYFAVSSPQHMCSEIYCSIFSGAVFLKALLTIVSVKGPYNVAFCF